jgi:hypothetical protein
MKSTNHIDFDSFASKVLVASKGRGLPQRSTVLRELMTDSQKNANKYHLIQVESINLHSAACPSSERHKFSMVIWQAIMRHPVRQHGRRLAMT